VKAVVLVGGEGTRLRPLTFTTPKPLLPIANQPHLERQLAWLAHHGVDEVVLSMAYLPDAFHRHFVGDRFGDVHLRYAVEDEPLGTAGAIRFAAEGTDERIVVCNGDILTGLDLTAMVRFHDERGAEATISLTEVEDPTAFGVVPTEDDGTVIAFVEKPAPDKAPSNWINAGTYIVEPSFLARIPPRLKMSVEREVFPKMLAQRGLLYGYRSGCYWLDIGTPEKYLQAHDDALDGRLGVTPAPEAREVAAGVWAEGDVVLDADAVVEPPVLLAAGAKVEAHARIRRAVLGPRAVVERDALVERSVLHEGARVSHGSVVRDSVVGSDAVLKPEVLLGDETIVGAGMTIASGTRISGGRVPAEGATRYS
jgi:NDP-sugar pyrophosphorylase family protein